METEGASGEGFASYLARYLQAKRGFERRSTGFEALERACDLLLAHDRPDLRVTAVACIVDRDARADARFGLSPGDTRAAALAWMGVRQARGRAPGPTTSSPPSRAIRGATSSRL